MTVSSRPRRPALASTTTYSAHGGAGHLPHQGEIARFFDGLDLAPPGLVFVEQWAPGFAREREPIPLEILAGVAVKR
ncbi:SAM-dependent methyltransferase [Planotetraspora sp. A-T 1434]|uniref:SAM-dependent methyltransferase n=1 Tax=Planotetraspora sp. A-T 1434 TaxID=2979219 RepID=UPI0021C18191|nr:SAM-dependent methyltransferase [Planotetraspora sp. A-T 1434]MCT9930637.1 SAM-dependent methyltransferase [Planotetraspora sp. A-T 1434]